MLTSVPGAAVIEVGDEPHVAQDDPHDTVFQVGETFTGDNLTITVANSRQITTSSSAVPAQNAQAIVYDVTVKNTSDKNYPVMMLSLNATAGDRVVEQVYDSGNGFGGTPTTKLLPGKSITFPVAFVDKPGDVVVQVSSLNGDTISFTQKR